MAAIKRLPEDETNHKEEDQSVNEDAQSCWATWCAHI